MNNFKKSLTVAKYTAIEVIKSKVLYNVSILGLVLLVIVFVAKEFTYGIQERVALDVGLGMLSLSSVAIALLMGVSLMSKEISSRTVYMIISRPISRSAFLAGKVMGLSFVLALNIAIISIITLSLFFWMGGDFNSLILWQIIFTFFESLIVLLLVVLFTLMTNNIVSVLLTFSLYLSGHFIDSAKFTVYADSRPWFQSLLEGYHFILPAFYKLNLKSIILYSNEVLSTNLLLTVLYGLTYSLFILTLSVQIFERKNLD